MASIVKQQFAKRLTLSNEPVNVEDFVKSYEQYVKNKCLEIKKKHKVPDGFVRTEW